MSKAGGSPTKTQFYSANGAGRDSYIWGNNGGFCPPTEPCKMEALGKFKKFSFKNETMLSTFPFLLSAKFYFISIVTYITFCYIV